MPSHRRIVVGLLVSVAALAAVHALEHVKTEENYPIDWCLSYTNVCNDLLIDLDCPTKVNSVDKCKGSSTYSQFQVRRLTCLALKKPLICVMPDKLGMIPGAMHVWQFGGLHQD